MCLFLIFGAMLAILTVAWIEDYNLLHWTNQHAVVVFFSELLCEVCAFGGILSRDSVTHFTW